MWIRHLTQNLGVNLAGVRILFELEERLGTRILERLYTEGTTEEPTEGTPEPDKPTTTERPGGAPIQTAATAAEA